MEKWTTWQSSWPACAIGTALQLAPAHHCADRRRHRTEPAHPLQTGLSGQHQGTRGHLCEHANPGRTRQRYVLLFLGGLAHEQVPHNCALVRQHLHGYTRPCCVGSAKTNHHPHQGRQPCINNAHQGDAHRVEAEVVAAKGQHHRVQPMGL